MNRAAAMVLLLAIASSWGGCTQSVSDRNLVLVDPAEARQLMEDRRKLLGGVERGACVDPRGEAAYLKGHIPGAIHLPFQKVSSENKKLREYDVLIVYGDDYNDPLANGMSKRLIELGFKEVRTLRGGLRAWTEAGLELESSKPETGR